MTKILLNYYSDQPFGVGYCLKFYEITIHWRVEKKSLSVVLFEECAMLALDLI